jgi:hypothetical protein
MNRNLNLLKAELKIRSGEMNRGTERQSKNRDTRVGSQSRRGAMQNGGLLNMP